MRGSIFVLIWLVCRAALADVVDVTIETRSLAGTTGVLVFDLIDGDGIPDNSVTITGYQSDGILLGPPVLTGGGSGDLSSSANLTDRNFFNELAAPLTLGNQIQFTLDATHNFAGGVPDNLSLFLLDPTGQNSLVATNITGDALFSLDLNGTPVQAATEISPGLSVTIGAPLSAVPEPSSLYLFAGSLVALMLGRGLVQRSR